MKANLISLVQVFASIVSYANYDQPAVSRPAPLHSNFTGYDVSSAEPRGEYDKCINGEHGFQLGVKNNCAKNQGELGSCTGYSFSEVLDSLYQDFGEAGEERFSPELLYLEALRRSVLDTELNLTHRFYQSLLPSVGAAPKVGFIDGFVPEVLGDKMVDIFKRPEGVPSSIYDAVNKKLSLPAFSERNFKNIQNVMKKLNSDIDALIQRNAETNGFSNPALNTAKIAATLEVNSFRPTDSEGNTLRGSIAKLIYEAERKLVGEIPFDNGGKRKEIQPVKVAVPQNLRNNFKHKRIISSRESKAACNPEKIRSKLLAYLCGGFKLTVSGKFGSLDGVGMSGGHAMTVVGYDKKSQSFILPNSWGDNRLLKLSEEKLCNIQSSGLFYSEHNNGKQVDAIGAYLVKHYPPEISELPAQLKAEPGTIETPAIHKEEKEEEENTSKVKERKIKPINRG